jgi:hypothetical protein
LRSSEPTLRAGTIEQVQRRGGALAFRRRVGSRATWAVMNFGGTEQVFRLQGLARAQRARVLVQSAAGAARMRWRETSLSVTIAPGTMAIIAPGGARAADPRF